MRQYTTQHSNTQSQSKALHTGQRCKWRGLGTFSNGGDSSKRKRYRNHPGMRAQWTHESNLGSHETVLWTMNYH